MEKRENECIKEQFIKEQLKNEEEKRKKKKNRNEEKVERVELLAVKEGCDTQNGLLIKQ